MIAKPPPDPMTSMWAWIAHDLRLYRMRAKMTGEGLGKVLGCVRSTVSRMESSQLQIDEKQAATLDKLWNTHGHFARLLAYARRAHDPDWFKQHTEYEASADVIKTYEAMVIPGLLQTPEYARVALATGVTEGVEELLETRMSRQETLRKVRPPVFWVLLDEGVLDRPVGGETVMGAQLARLLAEGEKSHISIRVVPRVSGAHIGLDGPFKIFSTETTDVAYTEAHGGGRLILASGEVKAFTLRYDRISAQALPEGSSRDLIRRTMEAMT